MRKNTILYLFFVFITVTNCGTLKETEITGNYLLKTGVGNEYIYFNKDGTFNFVCQIPLIASKSMGTWKLQENLIILNSYLDYKNDYFVIEDISEQSDLFIDIVDKENRGIPNVPVIIDNDKTAFYTDLNGRLNLKNIQLNKGDVLKIYPIELSDDKGNIKIEDNLIDKSFRIKVYEKIYEKKYFENEIVEFKKNKVFLNNHCYKKEL